MSSLFRSYFEIYYNCDSRIKRDLSSFYNKLSIEIWKGGLSTAADNPTLLWLIFPLSANRPAPKVRNGYLVFPLPANRPAPKVWNEFRINCVSPHDKRIAHLLFIVYTKKDNMLILFRWIESLCTFFLNTSTSALFFIVSFS